MKTCSTKVIIREMQIKTMIRYHFTSTRIVVVQSPGRVCSLQPHGLQHSRLPCPSPPPRVCSNSCASSWWCHPTISTSVVPFSSFLQSFPASGSFPASQLFTLGGQSIGTSVSVLPMNIQGWFPLGLTGLITPCCSRDCQESSQHHSSKASILWLSAFFMVQLSYPYMTTGKTIALTMWTFVSKVMSLLFNVLSRFVIAFLPRNILHFSTH